jgi:hypothetical protein
MEMLILAFKIIYSNATKEQKLNLKRSKNRGQNQNISEGEEILQQISAIIVT